MSRDGKIRYKTPIPTICLSRDKYRILTRNAITAIRTLVVQGYVVTLEHALKTNTRWHGLLRLLVAKRHLEENFFNAPEIQPVAPLPLFPDLRIVDLTQIALLKTVTLENAVLSIDAREIVPTLTHAQENVYHLFPHLKYSIPVNEILPAILDVSRPLCHSALVMIMEKNVTIVPTKAWITYTKGLM